MVIKINYTSSDIYVSTNVSPVYVVVNYSGVNSNDGVFVPYTGATTNVNLGAFTLTAASLIKSGGTSSQFLKADGSVDSSTYQAALTLTTTGTSGAATFSSNTLNIPQYQAVLTNPVTGTGATGQVAYWTGTSSQAGNNGLFWDAANARLGIGTNAPSQRLHVSGDAIITTTAQFTALTSNGGLFISNSTTSANGAIGLTGNGFIIQGKDGASTAFPLLLQPFGSNVILGGVTDGGQRLQVMGDAFIKGSGATSATTALTVQNSASSNMLRLLNDGQILIGPNTNAFFPMDKSSFATSLSGAGICFFDGSQSTGTYFRITGNNITDTGGASFALRVQRNFVVPSSTGTFVNLGIESTINQTGGANGVTRGLHVNPTLTAAADWRSIEWSNNTGFGLYGAGTANNYLAGSLGIGTTSPATKLEVVGASGIQIRNGATDGFSFQQANTNSWAWTPLTSGSNYIIQNSNVGIGTSTPSRKLHIIGASALFQNAGSFELDLLNTTSGNYLRATAGATDSNIGTIQNIPFSVMMNGARVGQFTSTNGNLILQNGGTFTDGGQRLQVQGDAFIKGSGATFSTVSLQVQNSAGTNLFRVYNSGQLRLGNTGSSPLVFPQADLGTVEDLAGRNLSFYSYTGSQSASSGRYFFGGENMVQTTGANFNIYSRSQFFPTSGTATLADIYINPQISQSGGANGVTRGLHVNPILTAAADWRSIEWSNNSGWGLYGAGTADNYLRGKLLINTTTVGTFDLDVNGTARVSGAATFSSSVTASSFIKSGGTSSQYLMADGSVTTGGGGGVDELQVALLSQVYG